MMLGRNELPRLYAIVNAGPEALLPPLDQTSALLIAGVEMVQLRAKHLSVRDTFDLAAAMAGKVHAAGAWFAVNDRPDIARAVNADVLHLGQDDIPPAAARKLFDGVIGLSTHNLAQVRQAMTEPIDYIGFGPVFSTVSKENPDPVTGLDDLEEAVASSTVPVVGIGGIGFHQLEAVLATGAASAAVISALEGHTRDEAVLKAERFLGRCADFKRKGE